jgi:cytidylate kinase
MAIITISRGTMSGGKKLAEMLAEKLGYRCISREIIVKTADEYGIPESKLFEAIKRSPSIIQKLTFERERYLAYIQATLCEYAKDDNMIYHGHAGHFLLEGVDHVLRVRIVADMIDRIKATAEQFKFSDKDALKYIEKIDRQRVKWTKFLYGRDWTSPELYDIVFNLHGMDLDFACEMIQHAVRQPRFRTTPASAQAMHNLLISSRVRATLAGLPGMRLEKIEVQADGGKVVIRGRTKSKAITEAILEAATEVPGVENVDNQVEIDYRDHNIE